jgi:putative ABC transport system permease protein
MRTSWSLALAGLHGRRKTTTALLVLVVTLASLGLVVGPSFIDQSEGAVDSAAARASVGEVLVTGPRAELGGLGDEPGVRAASDFQPQVDEHASVDGESEEVQLTGLDDPGQAVGRPVALEGRWIDAEAADEVVLDRSGARGLGVGVGDQVELDVAGEPRTFDVVGLAVDLTDCFYPDCDPIRAYTSEAAVTELGGGDRGLVQLVLDDPDQAEAVASRLLAQRGTEVSTQTWMDTRDDLLVAESIFGVMLSALGTFLLLASCVVLAGSLVARVAARRRELGLYKAVGATPGQVTAGLLLEHLALSTVGVLFGWVLGSLLTPAVEIGVVELLESGGPRFEVANLLLAFVVVTVLVGLATVVPSVRAGRESATEAVRDVPARRPGALSRLVGRVRQPALALGLQGTVARPGRTTLMVLALVLTVVGGVVAAGFVRTVDAVVAEPERTGDPYDIDVQPRGGADVGRLQAALDADSDIAGWYSETGRNAAVDGETFLARAIGGDPDDVRYDLGEGRSVVGPGEALAGYGFLERFDVEVGDVVEVDVQGGVLPLEVVGWYHELDDMGEVLAYRLEDLQRIEPDAQADALEVVVVDGVDVAGVAASLQEAFGSDATVVPVSVGDEEVAPVRAVIWIVAGLVGAVALAFLVSTQAAGARERARDLGVVRALGQSAWSTALQGGVAAAPLAVVALLMGIPLGLVLFSALFDAVAVGAGIGPGFAVAPAAGTLVLVALLVLVAASLLGVLSAAPMARRPIPELTRWE